MSIDNRVNVLNSVGLTVAMWGAAVSITFLFALPKTANVQYSTFIFCFMKQSYQTYSEKLISACFTTLIICIGIKMRQTWVLVGFSNCIGKKIHQISLIWTTFGMQYISMHNLSACGYSLTGRFGWTPFFVLINTHMKGIHLKTKVCQNQLQ